MRVALQVRPAPTGWRDALDAARATGVWAVALPVAGDLTPESLSLSARRDLRRLLQQLGLSLAGLALPRADGDLAHPALSDRHVDRATQAMTLARDLGSSTVFAPSTDLGPADGPAMGLARACLDVIANAADARGVCYAITGAEPRLAELLATVDARVAGVLFDPAAAVLAGEDPMACAARFTGRWSATLASDARRRGPAAERVPAGEGDVDWPALQGAHAAAEATGPLLVRARSADEESRALAHALALA